MIIYCNPLYFFRNGWLYVWLEKSISNFECFKPRVWDELRDLGQNSHTKTKTKKIKDLTWCINYMWYYVSFSLWIWERTVLETSQMLWIKVLNKIQLFVILRITIFTFTVVYESKYFKKCFLCLNSLAISVNIKQHKTKTFVHILDKNKEISKYELNQIEF